MYLKLIYFLQCALDDLTSKNNSLQNRIATPHVVKSLKVNKNNIPVESLNNFTNPSSRCIVNEVKPNVETKKVITEKAKTKVMKKSDTHKSVSVKSQNNNVNFATTEQYVKFKKPVKTNVKVETVSTDNSADANESRSTRRSSRLANKPSKNYKC